MGFFFFFPEGPLGIEPGTSYISGDCSTIGLTPCPTAQPLQIPQFGPSSFTCLLSVLSPCVSPTWRAISPWITNISPLPQCRAISTSSKCLYVVNPLGSPHTHLSIKLFMDPQYKPKFLIGACQLLPRATHTEQSSICQAYQDNLSKVFVLLFETRSYFVAQSGL